MLFRKDEQSQRLWRLRAQSKPTALAAFDVLKQYWDRAAIFTAVAYALGYAARSLHAWDFNFGALPGARFEYLVAGFMIAIPVATLAASCWGIYRLSGALRRWSRLNEQASLAVQKKVLTPMILIGFLALVPRYFLVDGSTAATAFGTIAGVLISSAVILSAVLATGADHDRERHPRDREYSNNAIRIVAITLHYVSAVLNSFMTVYFGLLFVLIFLAAAFYGAYALRFLPQEFGGVRAKCGILDLVTDQLSPELTMLLVEPRPSNAERSSVLRSKRLAVYSTSGPWLIRLETEEDHPHRSFRIADSAVKSVEWVSATTPHSTTILGLCSESAADRPAPVAAKSAR